MTTFVRNTTMEDMEAMVPPLCMWLFFRLTDHSDVFRVAISVVARFMIFVKVTLS